MSDINSSFMQSYLSQQLNMVEKTTPMPTEAELDQFRTYVKSYIDIDNDIKKLKGAIKDRNAVKKEISSYIVTFMSKFNIEDLNTKYGKIRYQVAKVNKPITQKVMKTRLLENFSPSITPEDLTEKIFEKKQCVEKHVLKRII